MPLTKEQRQQLQQFFNLSRFGQVGAVMTDLDGTAIHEFEGRYSIPQSVELGLNKIYELGRPVVLNTLRFPLSVIRTFGKEWYKISNGPIPTVLMNGSQLGFINRDSSGTFGYEEISSYPLTQDEVQEACDSISKLVDEINDSLVFYYPRDWKCGEIIWTPSPGRESEIQNKYLSASKVYSSPVSILSQDLSSQEICMIFLLVNIPGDRLMAYQHTKRNNFITHDKVNKQSGAEEIARFLSFDLQHSIGAGDSEMDTFLNSVGLAIHVGNPYLRFEGDMPAMTAFNMINYIPELKKIIKARNQSALEFYKLRINGSLDLFSL